MDDNEFNKLFTEFKKAAIRKINRCMHPDCSNKSINSHILQRNGILSSLIEDGHIIQMEINHFRSPKIFFKRVGANEAFSFKCFCKEHDDKLFKPIEIHPIDFSQYKNRLLFMIRTKYNEKFRKIVMSSVYQQLSMFYNENGDFGKYNFYDQKFQQENLGIDDIQKYEDLIWQDIKTGGQSFVLNYRIINELPVCLASFFDYETTEELNSFRELNGYDKEELSSVFINVFPYQGRTIVLIGYRKSDEKVVKSLMNRFIKESENKLHRLITNLMLFQCETWVISEKFYNERIRKCEDFFDYAAYFSNRNFNERKNFNLNLFNTDFCRKALDFWNTHQL